MENIEETLKSLNTSVLQRSREFRNEMEIERQQLLDKAGAKALEFLLNGTNTSARTDALNFNNQAFGIEMALSYYDSGVRLYQSFYGDVDGLKFIEETTRLIASHKEFCVKDSHQAALRQILAKDDSVEAVNLRETALSHYYKTKGVEFFQRKFQESFGTLKHKLVGCQNLAQVS